MQGITVTHHNTETMGMNNIDLSAVSPTHDRMVLNSLTLAFSGPLRTLDEGFHRDYSMKSLPRVRFTLCVWVFFYALFGLLDNEIMPDQKTILWMLRYTVICPVILGIIIASFFAPFMKYMQMILAGLMIGGGIGIIAMSHLVPPPYHFSYYSALMIILILGYTFSRARFIWAMTAGCILIIFYETAALQYGSGSTSILVENNFIFIGANIIGMFACYFMEMSARRDFFMNHLLEKEREKVKEANRILELRIQERTAMLEEINGDLLDQIARREQSEKKLRESQEQQIQNEKMVALGRLASGIAHQIRNPLEIILMGTEFISSSLPQDDRNAGVSVDKIKHAVTRANRIISDILKFSRNSELAIQPVDLLAMLKEVLILVESEAALHNVRIVTHFPDQPIMIEGDKSMLEQVVINLLSNAIDAMPRGGEINIRVYRTEASERGNRIGRRARDYFQLGDEMIVVEIEDTGNGIPAEELKQIFEPFFTTKKSGRGTGLGLSIAHLIVDRHKGVIEVESRLHAGTKFTVRLQPSIPERT